MNLFIDTGAFLAFLNADDRFHQPARQAWEDKLSSNSILFSSNYILLETTTLLQHRFGVAAVRLFEMDILPVIEVNVKVPVNRAAEVQIKLFP